MRPHRIPSLLLLALTPLACADEGKGEREAPPSEMLDGSPLYHVLPKDEILAIYEPEFVSGEEADSQMSPDEPVLGVFDGRNARAYSLWQLDHHEVVDDVLGDTPIAATW